MHLHLEDVVGDAVRHRISQDEPTEHGVRVERGSPLAGVLGEHEVPDVASWHHQAVDRLGEGLRPVAWAEDGTVEALALDGAESLMAVQWHPELQPERTPQQRLFRWLTAQGEARRSRGAS